MDLITILKGTSGFPLYFINGSQPPQWPLVNLRSEVSASFGKWPAPHVQARGGRYNPLKELQLIFVPVLPLRCPFIWI